MLTEKRKFAYIALDENNGTILFEKVELYLYVQSRILVVESCSGIRPLYSIFQTLVKMVSASFEQRRMPEFLDSRPKFLRGETDRKLDQLF